MKTEKRNIKIKKVRGIVVAMVLLLFVGISMVLGSNSTGGFVEKIIDIEIWAETFINLETGGGVIGAILSLDNGTAISEQKLNFYLDEDFLESGITDSEGYVEVFFGNRNLSLGNYSFKSIFQGDQILFLNASFAGERIEIIEVNGTGGVRMAKLDEVAENVTIHLNETNVSLMLNKTNLTILNKTNDTIFLEGLVCEEFMDSVLFSSGYSLSQKGSTEYQAWHPEHNCTELNVSDCFLGSINIQTRFISMDSPDSEVYGEGYVQISEPDESICDNPKKGTYSRYLAYESLTDEDKKGSKYCGENKNRDGKCGVELFDNYDYANCYGVKTYGSQYLITDVFDVTYTLCFEKEGQNEF